VADLDPAGRGLVVRERGRADRGQVPSPASAKAETVPLPAPSCAFDTNSWVEFVGRNSLPNGPWPCAANGEPAAAVRRPSPPAVKLSISEVATRVPTSLVPSALKSTSPG
jgi:hypothetical protein